MRFILLITVVIIATLTVNNCAPIRIFGDGLAKTADKLVHPREW